MLAQAEQLLKHLASRALLSTSPILGRLTGNTFSTNGMRFDLSSPAVTPETRAAIFWGIYESSERRAVLRFLRADLPVVELGASVGYLSVLTGLRVRPPRQIAVEASPELVPILERNIWLNGLTPVIQPIHAAIAYSGAPTVPFLASRDSTTGALARGQAAVLRTVEVPAMTLDQIVTKAGIEEFALICDIEGGECALFELERPPLGRRCSLLIAELHHTTSGPRNVAPVEIAELVRERWGMSLLWSDGKVWVFERPSARAFL